MLAAGDVVHAADALGRSRLLAHAVGKDLLGGHALEISRADAAVRLFHPVLRIHGGAGTGKHRLLAKSAVDVTGELARRIHLDHLFLDLAAVDQITVQVQFELFGIAHEKNLLVFTM